MLNFVLIANPETRRVELFQQALARFGLPAADLVPYEELLAGHRTLAEYEGSHRYFRFDAPERSFAVERGFIAAGADLEHHSPHRRISAADACRLPNDKGRILYPRQWYLGWRRCLQEWVSQIQGTPLNHPEEIVVMFDKVQCQRLLAQHGIPIPQILSDRPILSYAALREEMEKQDCQRVFVKLAHGSSASGVIAYERRGAIERAITTMERVTAGGELRFYNSRRVSQYTRPEEIGDAIDFVLGESAQIEAWMPKARLEGREFDARVVVINGKARQVVLRVGNCPMTNLHLGSDRRTVEDLPQAISPEKWAEMLEICERTAACFPCTFYCGIDLLISSNWQDAYILEVNAFGDLLQGITWEGQDSYTTELEMLLNVGHGASQNS